MDGIGARVVSTNFKYYIVKWYLCLKAWTCHVAHVITNFANQNKMQKAGRHGTKLWRSRNAETKCITDRAQKVDEKNEVICLIIIFIPRVMVIEMSRMAHFFVFPADCSKKSVIVCVKHLNSSERSYLALSENAID